MDTKNNNVSRLVALVWFGLGWFGLGLFVCLFLPTEFRDQILLVHIGLKAFLHSFLETA